MVCSSKYTAKLRTSKITHSIQNIQNLTITCYSEPLTLQLIWQSVTIHHEITKKRNTS